MERLTNKILTKSCNDPWDYCGLDSYCKRDCFKPTPCKLPRVITRLAEIEDILGNDYDLDRLRELVKADREGRCVVLKFIPGATVYRTWINLWNGKEYITDHYLGTKKICLDAETWGNVYPNYEAAEAALKGEQNE